MSAPLRGITSCGDVMVGIGVAAAEHDPDPFAVLRDVRAARQGGERGRAASLRHQPQVLSEPALASRIADQRSRSSPCRYLDLRVVWGVSCGRSSTRRLLSTPSSSRSSCLATRVRELRHARHVRDTFGGWRWSGTRGSALGTSTPRLRPTRWRPPGARRRSPSMRPGCSPGGRRWTRRSPICGPETRWW